MSCIKLVQDRPRNHFVTIYIYIYASSIPVHAVHSHIVVVVRFVIQFEVLCSKLCCLKDASVTEFTAVRGR